MPLIAPQLVLYEDEQKALDKEVMEVDVLLWLPPFRFCSEEILSSNIQRTISIRLFLVTERYTDFDAVFFEDDIYVLFIYFSYSRIGPN